MRLTPGLEASRTTGCQPSLSNVKLRVFAPPFTSTKYCTDQSTDDTSTRIGWSLVNVNVNGPRPCAQARTTGCARRRAARRPRPPGSRCELSPACRARARHRGTRRPRRTVHALHAHLHAAQNAVTASIMLRRRAARAARPGRGRFRHVPMLVPTPAGTSSHLRLVEVFPPEPVQSAQRTTMAGPGVPADVRCAEKGMTGGPRPRG